MTEQKHPRELHVGFIGVGVMGRPMVSNLLKAGFPCTIYDINPAPVEALVAEGATSASSAAEVAKSSDIFVTMVVNDAQLAATLFEPGNAASALKPSAIVIGMSTMSVRMVREAAARLQEVGVHYLDAPVSGGEAAVFRGAFAPLVGSAPPAFAGIQARLSGRGSDRYQLGRQAGAGRAANA